MPVGTAYLQLQLTEILAATCSVISEALNVNGQMALVVCTSTSYLLKLVFCFCDCYYASVRPIDGAGGIMFSGCMSVCACVSPSVHAD